MIKIIGPLYFMPDSLEDRMKTCVAVMGNVADMSVLCTDIIGEVLMAGAIEKNAEIRDVLAEFKNSNSYYLKLMDVALFNAGQAKEITEYVLGGGDDPQWYAQRTSGLERVREQFQANAVGLLHDAMKMSTSPTFQIAAKEFLTMLGAPFPPASKTDKNPGDTPKGMC